MAASTARSFPRHTHDQYGIGVVDTGGHASWSGRGPAEAGRGSFICVNPGAYGLDGTGMLARGTRMQNLWRYALMLGYSETYLPGIPPIVQEPLVKALAKIAQWSGKDEELKVFFE